MPGAGGAPGAGSSRRGLRRTPRRLRAGKMAKLNHDYLLITRDCLKNILASRGGKRAQKNWIVVALRNQYVTVGGKVKRQTRGLAQGKADAVRLSALVLSFYEMAFVLRCCHMQ